MKKSLLLFCLTTVLFVSCKKESDAPTSSVSTDYKAFIIEFTATWCPYCGDNAYPNWDPNFAAHLNKVTGMSCHPSDGIVDNDYPEFDDLKTFMTAKVIQVRDTMQQGWLSFCNLLQCSN